MGRWMCYGGDDILDKSYVETRLRSGCLSKGERDWGRGDLTRIAPHTHTLSPYVRWVGKFI